MNITVGDAFFQDVLTSYIKASDSFSINAVKNIKSFVFLYNNYFDVLNSFWFSS